MAPFVGRTEQLAAFRAALDGGPEAARIIGIHGPAGSGRSRFAVEALNRLRAEGMSVVAVSPDPRELANVTALTRAVAGQLPNGGAAIHRAFSRTGADAPTETAIARLVAAAFFHEIYSCMPDNRSCLRPIPKRVVLVLDDFDTAPPGVQSWVAHELLPQLQELRGYLEFLLVPITERALSADLEPVAWNAQPARLVEIELPRLSREESLQLLASFARRADESNVCYELGEGLPGAMLGLLRHSLRPANEIADALRKCTGPVADLLVAISRLGTATPEGLRLALGAEAAAPWIARGMPADLPVPCVGFLQADGVSLPGPIAKLVEQHVAPRCAATAKRAADAARTVAALHELFPSETARRRSALLSVFRFFDEPALRACFEGEAPAFLDLVRTHEHSFVRGSGERWRLDDESAGHLRRWAQALGGLDLDGLRLRAEVVWQERAVELKRIAQEAGTQVEKLTADRDRVQKETEEARAAVAAAQRDQHRTRTSRLTGDGWRLGASLVVNAAGVACLWAALLSEAQRTSFLVLGGMLIVFGLCTPALSRRNGRGESEAREHAAQAQLRLERAQGALEFVETRYAAIQRRLADERRRADEANNALHEPYVA